jgi:hypothetical protein
MQKKEQAKQQRASNYSQPEYQRPKEPLYEQSYRSQSYNDHPQPSREPVKTTAAPIPGRGMKLGMKGPRASLIDTIKADEKIRDSPLHRPSQSPKIPVAEDLTQNTQKNGVHVDIEEKISATLDKEGGLQNMEINGSMSLKIHDSSSSKVKLSIAHNNDLQFKALWINLDSSQF